MRKRASFCKSHMKRKPSVASRHMFHLQQSLNCSPTQAILSLAIRNGPGDGELQLDSSALPRAVLPPSRTLETVLNMVVS